MYAENLKFSVFVKIIAYDFIGLLHSCLIILSKVKSNV